MKVQFINTSFTPAIKVKGLSRAERKAKAALYRQTHPVLSGAVRVETYQPKAAWYNGKRVS